LAIPSPPTNRRIFPLISVATNIAAFPFHDRFVDRPGTRRFIVVLLNFSTGIDGPIRPAHRDSARVSNPPAGRILLLKCTPLNEATAPLPGGIRPHPNTRTSTMVLRHRVDAANSFYCTQRLRRRAWVDDDAVHLTTARVTNEIFWAKTKRARSGREVGENFHKL